MAKQVKESMKHHFVPQARLKQFSIGAKNKQVWVFDKQTDRAFESSILNAGSENHFNTVTFEDGRWNFEYLFEEIDSASASLIREIIEKQSLSGLESRKLEVLFDLFVSQLLRTHFARSTPLFLAKSIREIVSSLGFDPDSDPDWSLPSEASLRLEAVRSFLRREEQRASIARLIPALFSAKAGSRFVISDHPVAVTNQFPYGDLGLSSHGIIMLLPITPAFALALVCPTIIARYEAIDRLPEYSDRRARTEKYRSGFRSGNPICISASELESWNCHQVAKSKRFLYAATDDFDFAKQILQANPSLRNVETHVWVGEMGQGLPNRRGMPAGLWLVIEGNSDHCMMPIVEIDKTGEGLTAKTKETSLLEMVSKDTSDLRAELYEDGDNRQLIGAAIIERFGDPIEGWFRVVHRDPSLRSLARQIDAK
jgi:Protein of unknown function (DUF4238)